MVNGREEYFDKLNKKFDKLYQEGHLRAKAANDVKVKFDDFANTVVVQHREQFVNFDYSKQRKNNQIKNTKIEIKCVGGGGGNLLYLLCLTSNTMPQLEQSSLQPSTVLHDCHLLQTTSYSHLLLLHLLISRIEKPKQQQARNPPPP